MFYEIRRYQTRPGRRDDWVRYMENVVIPFQVEQGMSVTASFVDEEDPDGYVWIRRFADEEERIALYANVYESERWQQEIGPAVRELLLVDQIKVTRAVPTAVSGLR
ncbi:NIPSNAP family protein [Lentzea albida]|uniref:NIPSNAP protein n=1 Tax=Lentzea albida TaxID=65499 RepID=A0A1H9K161_9PSEU|nr:NIPSNAP family protein [Lentzea albida]SEQ92565.1 NIPSNAP protein [Lentzea albida]